MNSLSDLNNYSGQGFAITDQRAAGILYETVFFGTRRVFCPENASFQALIVNEITDVINQTTGVTMSIDVSNYPGAQVVWPSNLVSVSGNIMSTRQVGNVYTIDNIWSKPDWDLVKSPVISMGTNPPDTWSYITTIKYNGTATLTWSTEVSTIQLDQLSAPTDYYFDSNITGLVTGQPTVTSLDSVGIPSTNLTLTVMLSDTSSVTNMSTQGIGGTSAFDLAARRLTVTGTLAQVNSHLSSLRLTANSVINTWTATYSLYNATSGFTSTQTQTFRPLATRYLTYTSNINYVQNAILPVTGNPQITDLESSGRTYVMVVVPEKTYTVVTLSTNLNNSGGTATFNTTTKELTIVGTREQVNNHLNNIALVPASGNILDVSLFYRLKYQGSSTILSSRFQEISLAIFSETRYYKIHNYEPLFATVLPGSSTASVYDVTLTLDRDIGFFTAGDNLTTPTGWDPATLTYTTTGTSAQNTAALTALRFYSKKNVIDSAQVTIKIKQSGIVLLNHSFALVGPDSASMFVGATSVNSVGEDSDFTLDSATNVLRPHWSDQWSYRVNVELNGSPSTLPAWLIPDGGFWINIGTDSNAQTGIYINLPAVSSLAAHTMQITNAGKLIVGLKMDFVGNFSIIRTLVSGGRYDGFVFDGGTIENQIKTININSTHLEYILNDTFNYAEDSIKDLIFTITDQDARGAVYSLTVKDYLTVPEVWSGGRFYIGGLAQEWGEAITINGTKSLINSLPLKYEPKPDWDQGIKLYLTLTKTLRGMTVTQASNVIVNLTCTSTNIEYTAITGVTASAHGELVNLSGYQIIDGGSDDRTYTVVITQQKNGQPVSPGKFYFEGDAVSTINVAYIETTDANGNPRKDYASATNLVPDVTYSSISLSGTRSYINSRLNLLRYRTGTATGTHNFRFNLTRTSPTFSQMADQLATVTLRTPTAGQVFYSGILSGYQLKVGKQYIGRLAEVTTTSPDYSIFGAYVQPYTPPLMEDYIYPSATFIKVSINQTTGEPDWPVYPGSNSSSDGLANCNALYTLGSETDYQAIEFARNFRVEGRTDWYLPSALENNLLANKRSRRSDWTSTLFVATGLDPAEHFGQTTWEYIAQGDYWPKRIPGSGYLPSTIEPSPGSVRAIHKVAVTTY